MERKTISEFDAVTSVADADLMLVVQGGVYKQATALQVAGGGSTLYATAAQGAKADTALQPGDIGDTVQGYSAILNATTASFTTADETKLDGIEALADVTDTANVTAAGALMDSEVTNLAAVKAFDPADYATAAQGALADSAQQPPAEGAFVDGDKTKLDGIEALADVTDTANVTAAGAVMDSEVTNLAAVKAFDPADYQPALAEGDFADGDKTKLDGIETGADVTDTANVTAAGALMDSEVTNLAQVKAFDSSDYATAAQGTTADNAVAKSGDDMTGTLGIHDADEDSDSLSGTTPSLDVSAAQDFTLTTSGNTTISITNAPTGRAWVRTLTVTLGGAHTLAITSADWGDNGAPTAASGDVLVIQLWGVGTSFKALETWRSTA